jgi:hypothetical protein
MSYTIPFNQFDHNFCESTLYAEGRHPEYFNALSSLFITFIGLNAMRKPHLTIFFYMMYSCLAVNGVLSLMYHYQNSIGYGLLDRMSMVLLGFSTSYICYTSIRKLTNFSFYANILIHLSIVSYYSFLLTVAGLHNEIVFNALFTAFLGSIALYMYAIKMYIFYNEIHIDQQVLSLGWKGVRYIFTSAIFWILTEGLCSHISFIKYLFGHVWWHIFVSYGGYLVSIVPRYILLQKTDEIEIKYDVFGLPYLDVDMTYKV